MLILECFRASGAQINQRRLHQAQRELAEALLRSEELRLQAAIADQTARFAQARIDRLSNSAPPDTDLPVLGAWAAQP